MEVQSVRRVVGQQVSVIEHYLKVRSHGPKFRVKIVNGRLPWKLFHGLERDGGKRVDTVSLLLS